MREDKKYNPVAAQEGIVLLVIIVISVLSAAVLAIYNLFQHL
jgi:hypothetical protein